MPNMHELNLEALRQYFTFEHSRIVKIRTTNDGLQGNNAVEEKKEDAGPHWNQ
jgi:hypothetical protein